MTRPGDRLREIAARCCSPRAMERLIDPVLADLQAEHGNAARHGRMWKSRWIRIAGYTALLKAITVYGWERVTRIPQEWTVDDYVTLSRTIGCSLLAIIGATLLLVAPVWRSFGLSQTKMLVYMIPQALGLAVPLGFTIGIVCGLGRGGASRRVIGSAVAIAAAGSVMSFVNVGWIMPVANQSFRVGVSGNPDILKGPPELTLSELGLRIDSSKRIGDVSGAKRLAIDYHTRSALAYAALPLAHFALSVLSRYHPGRLMLGLVTGGAFLGYYVLLWMGMVFARNGTLPPFVAAWIPNATFVGVSVAVSSVFHRSNTNPPV